MPLPAVDLVVAGTGVAGLAAARTAQRMGASVLLVGPAPSGADKPGESLAASALTVLHEMGCGRLVAGGPHRPSIVAYSAWGLPALAQRHAAGHPEGNGVILDRPAFEAGLFREVLAAGVTWLDGEAQAAHVRDGRWQVTLGSGEAAEGRFLVDATGRTARLARHLAPRYRADRLVAAWTMLTRTDRDVEPTPASLIEAVPTGWWYASLLPDERLSLAFFSDPDLLPRGLSRDVTAWRDMAGATHFIRRWLETATFVPDAPPRLASAATLWTAPAAGTVQGAGWAAVGDAACALDPLSSHGLATALWTGHRAARAAFATLQGDGSLLATYADTLAAAVGGFLEERARVYGAERRWRDLPFWARRVPRAPAQGQALTP